MALDGILRPGNAGSNTGADQVAAIEAALEQLPPRGDGGEILVRGDSAACVHAVADFCREGDIRFSVGHELSAEVREAIGEVPDDAWVGAISQDGVPVAEHPDPPPRGLRRRVDRPRRPLHLAASLAADMPARARPPRRPAQPDRHRWLASPVLPHRPGCRGHRRARPPPPRPRPCRAADRGWRWRWVWRSCPSAASR